MHRVIVICAVLFLAACNTTPSVPTDALPELEPEQGLIAFEVESPLPLWDFTLRVKRERVYLVSFEDLEVGRSFHLRVVQSGRYCLEGYGRGSRRYRLGSMLCFDVSPGELSYGGVFSIPEPDSDAQIQLDREGGREAFDEWLATNYPLVFDRYQEMP